ncbi:unnamed protein product [Ilex paraguariensis]|uniref:Transcription repressor n=1 Tax=Ilex paraguariensis TaxID=185542 RepID=A0ABC8RDI4_9AQUA
MGNYRFRLSDMIPNAWFYKLRDMSKTRSHSTSHSIKKKLPPPTTKSKKPNQSQLTHSNYQTTDPNKSDKFYNSPTNPKASDTHFPDPPRKSSQRRTRRKTIYKPSPISSRISEPTLAQGYSTDSSFEPDLLGALSSEFESETTDAAYQSFTGMASWSNSCSCKFSSSATDIVIDMNEKSYRKTTDKIDGFDPISELDLPPILTKPAKISAVFEETSSSELEEIKAQGSVAIRIVKEDKIRNQKETKISPLIRKSVSYSSGVKLRANSPKLAGNKIQAQGRKSVSTRLRSKSKRKSFLESFAIVKSSFDPEKDFRESMMEMIVENNIRASKDLEELLACYLSLNSGEYHDLIVKAFEQIWFNMPDLRL